MKINTCLLIGLRIKSLVEKACDSYFVMSKILLVLVSSLVDYRKYLQSSLYIFLHLNVTDELSLLIFMQNLKSNFTLWRLGTLPPGLIAFKGHVHPIDPSWHLLGLGYQEKTDISSVEQAAVIHYNGQSKPWLEIGFKHLQQFWTRHVNYSNEFIRNCHIMEPQL